ncbi:MAG TPA: gluconokinase [Frateuria sp.]|uniref:gluconokinase n=1 Tax=Frateuria sp. TaxID=2211372 RepID=UPI002DECA3D3|nr:gluconokinase [Frateuria sp.]
MSAYGAKPAWPEMLVVMGVSGSGKTTVARRLAQSLNYAFLDGDDLHSAANIAKMSAGVPLEDADRAPWLDAIVAWMRHELADKRSGVVACSALKRVYRDRLRQAGPAVRFVYLDVEYEELARRMRARRHFMPPELLGSQLATLEAPDGDEQAMRVDADGTVADVMARVLQALARERSEHPGAQVRPDE